MWSMHASHVAGSDGRHWKIAECSLSIGIIVAPPVRTASTNRAPPTTSASLFASSSRLPARAAARTAGQPRRADDGRHHLVDIGMRGELLERARALPALSVRRPAARTRSRSAFAAVTSGIAA
jgi:hypothetical protein